MSKVGQFSVKLSIIAKPGGAFITDKNPRGGICLPLVVCADAPELATYTFK